MVCCPTKGGASSVDDYKNEIIEAQRRGIDGFALNCGGWQKTEPHYKERAFLIYEAALQLGTGFELFISADGAALHEVEDILNSLKEHPNQFRFKGKPVLSTFGGEGENNLFGRALTEQVHQLGGIFVPYFYPQPNITEHPQKLHAEQLLRSFPDVDGFFYYGAAGNGDQISHSNSVLAKAFLGAGKLYMASITPYYRGNGGNFRLFETRGFEAMAKEWEGAIRDDVPWVELVTWNDWNESSYLAPFGLAKDTELWDGHFGTMMLSHVAYLDASRYYIDWFKKGTPPAIQEDKLYYFYRLHPKQLPVTVNARDEAFGKAHPGGAEALLDHVFVTLFLTKPAQLIISSGHKKRTFYLQAGVNHVSMPFGVGRQKFTLVRNEKVLIEKYGEHPISKYDGKSRFNYFGGSAVANSAH
ncbi:glycosyl hydrolase family 71 [Pontibacter ummariensis]|uniref:Glycosyl hydrolase family 71 n=2 Tax=Pontibacter ummariensis TaxID=1610492 RepID=A0A239K4T4_9BACT|nr:glycosyl hydrolase family 71 [Pontibacter ummariensis]SNT13031.1 Glycosyl hydrolase family 71 [Pontibacter ummariensis]